MWGPALRSVRNHEVTFVTTNYDRAIELAANAEGVQLTDGFGSFADGEMARWIGLQQSKVNPSIVKLHGSTDWYSTSATGEPIKLRHPMPLFGRGTLRLPNNVDLGSALILPSREKLLTRPPYPRLSQAFLNAADACEAAIFIGTSLRDHHIRDAATEIAKSRPAFIVNPEGDNLGIGRAVGVAQSASRFLISTLPSALLAPEPVSALGNAVQDPQHEEPNTLELVRLATSTHEHSERRCQAIEMLDARSVALDGHFVRALVSDKDATVSRYALGLVPASTDRNILITTLQSPHVTDAAFAEELALLQQILSE
jgi:hypothetical protein